MRPLVAVAQAVLFALPLGCASSPPCPCNEMAPEPAPERPAACTADEHRQFDFWAGSWEVSVADGRLAGHNEIEVAHGGCALLEHWRSVTGGSGTSTNYYDPVKHKWVQNWVDANGSVIQLEGGMREGAMHLEGRYATPDGKEARMRGIWTPLDDGRVRQRFETQTGDGPWTLWFEGFYAKQEAET